MVSLNNKPLQGVKIRLYPLNYSKDPMMRKCITDKKGKFYLLRGEEFIESISGINPEYILELAYNLGEKNYTYSEVFRPADVKNGYKINLDN